MRSPKRIGRILRLVEKLWREYPDRTFGEVVVGFCISQWNLQYGGVDAIVQQSDDSTERYLRECMEKILEGKRGCARKMALAKKENKEMGKQKKGKNKEGTIVTKGGYSHTFTLIKRIPKATGHEGKVLRLLKRVGERKNNPCIAMEDIVKESEKCGMGEKVVQKTLDRLFVIGDVYRPKYGFIKLTKDWKKSSN